MIDNVFDGCAVMLDLEPATALLLRRIIEAGVRALHGHLSAAHKEELAGLRMFLGNAAVTLAQKPYRGATRPAA